MVKKMWDGRFSKSTDEGANDFNSSISFDCRLIKHDIEGSKVHALMLEHRRIISSQDCNEIIAGLDEILDEFQNNTLEFDPQAEDIHMFIESLLTDKIGEAGKKLHTGRSRNDQVALDFKLYIRDEIKNIKDLLKSLCETLIEISADNLDTIMPGYTHLQKAQPITFAHHLMAYVQMFLRDISRLSDCNERIDTMPLGSGALAATTYDLDREFVCKKLGFSKPTENSLDAVSDRDHAIEFLSCLSIIMMHISRFSEEIIIWSTREFSFVEADDSFSTGSSIMPQKKNPDMAELSRGKSGRVFGDLITLLTVMKGLPLAYNKDMQEDKECVFDSTDTVKKCLSVFNGMVKTLKINKDAMHEAAKTGFTNATDLADYLVLKGIPFRDAHRITGEIVKYCINENISLSEMKIDKYKEFSELIQEDVYSAIDLITCVENRKIIGGPAPSTVLMSIENARKELEEYF